MKEQCAYLRLLNSNCEGVVFLYLSYRLVKKLFFVLTNVEFDFSAIPNNLGGRFGILHPTLKMEFLILADFNLRIGWMVQNFNGRGRCCNEMRKKKLSR